MEGVLPSGLTVCGCCLVSLTEVVPEAFHMVLDVYGISLRRVQLGQGPNLCQSCGNLCRVPYVFKSGEWYGGIGPLVDSGVHKVFGVLSPLEVLFVR